MKNALKKLSAIQVELKVPKEAWNDFGKYYYRNAETILETAKPVCHKHGAVLTVGDKMILHGDRYFVEATATLWDIETGESVSASASAREPFAQKGMNEPQITGAASSYARKYALGGLFALDDTKDADATNTHGKEPKVNPVPVVAKTTDAKGKMIGEVAMLCGELNLSPEWLEAKLQKDFSKKALSECTQVELRRVINGLKKHKASKEG